MKVIELFEYKNKYYKPVPKKPKARGNKTLWYDKYENWVGDIQMRFPDTSVYYDEENEEIIAASNDCKECYGKWSKKKDKFPGVTFFKARNLRHIRRNGKALKKIKAEEKKKEQEQHETGGGFSAMF